MRSAVVLTGGTTARFGERDEPTVESGSDARLHRTVERVAPAVDDVVVSCRREQRDAVAAALSELDCRIAADAVPGGGPVAAVRSGCRLARARWTFVTAAPVPFVRPRLVTRLFEAVEGDGAVATVGGRPRPLAAVYRTESAIDAATTTLGLGSSDASDVLDRLAVARVAGPSPARAAGDATADDALRAIQSRST